MSRATPNTKWLGAVSTLTVCGTDVAPTATMVLLRSADQSPIDVGCMLYGATAHCVEANTAAVDTKRRFLVVIPPGCHHARMFVTRAGDSAGTSQSDTTAGSTTSGGFAGVSVIKMPSGVGGAETYLPAAIYSSIIASDSDVNDAPAVSMDRPFKVPETLVAGLELFEVNVAAGVSVAVFQRTADLETL